MATLLERVAGAPITWGVSEVLGWGHQMHSDRVLSEMGSIGLRATELGPDGFLPTDPHELDAALAAHGLRAVAAFVPLVLYEPALLDRELERAAAAAVALATCGAEVLVLAAATAVNGYEASADLDPTRWTALLTGLERVAVIAADHGLVTALHPHVGTVVERHEHVERVLHDSTTPLCLDTGHLMVGGTDPSMLAQEASDRIAHVHLKDVDGELADRVRRGRLGYQDAVAAGLYRPLGDGDLDIAGIVRTLEGSGYRGWYVLEQDAVLGSEPGPDQGPVRAAERSLRFLAAVAGSSRDAISLVGEGKRGMPHGAATHVVKGGMG